MNSLILNIQLQNILFFQYSHIRIITQYKIIIILRACLILF